MADYHFNPDKKKSSLAADRKKLSDILEPLSKSKLKVAIVLIFLALVVFIGPEITGNLLYEDPEYTLLSKNPDFPHFSKNKANLELYKCTDDLSDTQSQYNTCDSALSNARELYNICNMQKTETMSELQTANDNYNSCEINAATLKSGLDTCNSEKQIKDADLGLCNSQLNEKESRLHQLESEKEDILSNYASSVCCTLKQLSDPSLKYYTLINNRIVCSDSEGTEFTCD